jgi:hypothetical protein
VGIERRQASGEGLGGINPEVIGGAHEILVYSPQFSVKLTPYEFFAPDTSGVWSEHVHQR